MAAEAAENSVDSDLEEKLERVMVNDVFITNLVMNQSPMDDLITSSTPAQTEYILRKFNDPHTSIYML